MRHLFTECHSLKDYKTIVCRIPEFQGVRLALVETLSKKEKRLWGICLQNVVVIVRRLFYFITYQKFIGVEGGGANLRSTLDLIEVLTEERKEAMRHLFTRFCSEFSQRITNNCFVYHIPEFQGARSAPVQLGIPVLVWLEFPVRKGKEFEFHSFRGIIIILYNVLHYYYYYCI